VTEIGALCGLPETLSRRPERWMLQIKSLDAAGRLHLVELR
jgi:hypothetical protein